MLERASGSLPIDPGHPPAAYGVLGYQVPDSFLAPSEAARLCRQPAAAQQPGRRDTTRFFGTRSKASMDWATTHAGPQAIALCQHPELHMARHDDFMTSSQLCYIAPGRFLSVCLNREGLVELCLQNSQ